MSPPRKPNPLAPLQRLIDPLALAYHLSEETGHGATCDHTWQHTRGYFAEYAPDVDADAVVAALEGLGARCDCTALAELSKHIR